MKCKNNGMCIKGDEKKNYRFIGEGKSNID